MPRPDPPLRALAPLARTLPEAGSRKRSPWMAFELEGERLLIVSTECIEPATWAHLSDSFAHDPPATVSRSAAGDQRAMLVAPAGLAGVDVETLERIAASTKARDAWLADGERASIDAATDPALELACHWVLKEAYGKALGVGLALPLDALAFAGENGTIVLRGAAAPAAGEGWRFGLFRRAGAVVAVAYR